MCALCYLHIFMLIQENYIKTNYIFPQIIICTTTSKDRLKAKNMGAFDWIYTDPVSPLLRPETPLCMSQQREVKEFLRNSHFLQLARTFNFVKNVVF